MKKKIKANKTIMLLLTLLLTLSLVAGLSACGEGAKEKSDKKGTSIASRYRFLGSFNPLK